MPPATSRPLSPADIRPLPRTSPASIPAVARLGQKLADAFGMALSRFDDAPWRITLDRIGDGPWTATDGAAIWFRVETRNGSLTLHLALDRGTVSSCCEGALGGSGFEVPYEFPGRPYSGIETRLIGLVLKHLEAQVTATLAEELATPVSLFEGEIDSVHTADEGEWIVFHFLTNVFGYSGELSLAANPGELAAQFDAGGSEASSGLSDGPRSLLHRSLAKTDIAFSITLGDETLLVDDLAALAPGRLVPLASGIKTPVLVCSDGTPVFKGSLSRAGEKLAVRVGAFAE
jgi:flagellar motor switch protein FliM